MYVRVRKEDQSGDYSGAFQILRKTCQLDKLTIYSVIFDLSELSFTIENFHRNVFI